MKFSLNLLPADISIGTVICVNSTLKAVEVKFDSSFEESTWVKINLKGVDCLQVCNCSMFCCTLLYVHFSIAIILMGKRELIALLNLSSWCLVMVEWLFLTVPRGCLQFVIVVFPDHTHLLFLRMYLRKSIMFCCN